MNINQIIKEKRKSLSLTQEQLANQLGVSTPAVSKWESGASYPDITILPNLAKILKTDINTLLSFQSDLSDEEINNRIKDLSSFALNHTIDEIFEKAMDIISEYPNCYKLILNVALSLDGFAIFKVGNSDLDKLEKLSLKVEELYRKIMDSTDVNIKSLARQQLIFREVNRKNFDKAEELLETIPDKLMVDKSELKTRVEFTKGNLNEAKKAAQEKLYALTSDVNSQLLLLLDIELDQGNIETAKYITDVSCNLCKTLDIWEYTANLGKFQFYIKTKNADAFVETLSALIETYGDIFKQNDSPLYSEINLVNDNYDDNFTNNFIDTFMSTIIKSLETDDELDFVKDNPKFKEIIASAIKKSNR